MPRKSGQIFKIDIISTRRQKVLAFVRMKLKAKGFSKPFLIFTPNPEIAVLASTDKKFKNVLNSADLLLPDGIGLALAKKFLELPNTNSKILRPFLLFGQGFVVGIATFIKKDWLFASLYPIKGREMFLELLKLANRKRWKVFLLGGGTDVVDKTAEFLRKIFKKVEIMAASGPSLDKNGLPMKKEDERIEKQVIKEINDFKPQLLFVAFGAPKQERWLFKWRAKLKIGGAMAVGGTFDYISGRAKLPPAWIENLGLEWVWRLITQPRRLKRIFTAFPIFPLKVFWYKLTL